MINMLDNLEEAINKKQYYKMITMDINIPPLKFNTFEGKIIIAIRDMYNCMHNIISDFRSFSNWLYDLMIEVNNEYNGNNTIKLDNIAKKSDKLKEKEVTNKMNKVEEAYIISFLQSNLSELKRLVMQSTAQLKPQEISEVLSIVNNLEEAINKKQYYEVDLYQIIYLPLRNTIFQLGDRINKYNHAQELVVTIRKFIDTLSKYNNVNYSYEPNHEIFNNESHDVKITLDLKSIIKEIELAN